MAIIAQYKPLNIVVEVVSVLTAGSRKRALIRAIEGQPFHFQSHGGPGMTSSAVVSPDLLADVHQEPAEPQAPRYPRKPRPGGPRPKLIQPWTEEERERYIQMFPPRYNASRPESKARGGMNND